MKCGLCRSGVTAQEKHKQLKGGGTATYIYYGCTRTKKPDCPIAYLREDDLIVQLSTLIDTMSMDALGLRKNLKEDIERHNKFQEMLGAEVQKIHLRDADLKNYAKHVLNTGTTQERRDVLTHLKDRLILKDWKITLKLQARKFILSLPKDASLTLRHRSGSSRARSRGMTNRAS